MIVGSTGMPDTPRRLLVAADRQQCPPERRMLRDHVHSHRHGAEDEEDGRNAAIAVAHEHGQEHGLGRDEHLQES